ncbi:MAG: hypothetical protein EXS55_01720 [Candidatus Magasanikbacteria bacterium]|nr:hypothetical protein [Candidatus Magasanikbacteria bacterium]
MSKFKLFFILFFSAPLIVGAGCNIGNRVETPTQVVSSSLNTGVAPIIYLTPLESLIISSVNSKSYESLVPYVATPTFVSYLGASEYLVHLPPRELPKELIRADDLIPLNFDQNSSEIKYIKETQLSGEEQANGFVGFSKDQKKFIVFTIINNHITDFGISFY